MLPHVSNSDSTHLTSPAHILLAYHPDLFPPGALYKHQGSEAQAVAKRSIRLGNEQEAAVAFREGTAVVLSGAGSGKTLVIEQRAMALLDEETPAGTILVVAYTNKAAEEIRARIVAPQAKGITISTIHALGLQILREFHSQAKLPTAFSVATSQVQLQLLDEVRAALKAKWMAGIPSSKALRGIISYHRNTGASLRTPLRATNRGLIASKRTLKKVLKEYEKRKLESRLVDFDDLIVRSEELLATNKVVRKQLRKRYRHIMVDEFQDLNVTQLRLLQLLGGRPRKGRSLVFVGDPAQSIFGFRGAGSEIWNEVRAGSESFALSINYRSSAPIVALANAVMSSMGDGLPVSRARKNAPSSPPPYLTRHPDAQVEAMAVCDKIEELRAKGCPLSDQVVLYRDSAFARHIVEEIRARKIPYRKIGGGRASVPALLRDVLAVVEAGTNPRHRPAISKVLQLIPGIGPKKAGKLLGRLKGGVSHRKLISLIRRVASDRPGGSHIVMAMKAADPNSMKPSAAVEQVITSLVRLGIAVEKDTLYFRQTAQLDELLEVADNEHTLQDALGQWALISGDDTTSQGDDYISVSSIHAAKGREWSVVYIPQLIEGHLPHCKATENGNVLEEARMFYVAITRARKHLYLSHSTAETADGVTKNMASQFLRIPGIGGLISGNN